MVASLGFILLGGVFVCAGTEHFWNFRMVSGMLADKGLPAAQGLLALGSVVEIVAGLCLAMGVMRPYAAVALILFTIAASLMALNFWRYSGMERQGLRSAFIINVAVVGGLLLAATA